MDAGKAPGNKPCVDSMLVTENRKKINMGPLSCHEAHCPMGEAGSKETPAEEHAFIRRVVRTQKVKRAEDMVSCRMVPKTSRRT